MASSTLGFGVKLLGGENSKGRVKDSKNKMGVDTYLFCWHAFAYWNRLLVGAKFCMYEWELGCRYDGDAIHQHDLRWRKLTARPVAHMHAYLLFRINTNYMPVVD